MFLNYFPRLPRPTALNLLVARVVLVLYASWKLVSYEWSAVAAWPWTWFQGHPHAYLIPWPWMLDLLWVEVAICLAALACTLVGYRLAVTPLVAAFLLAHLSGIHLMVTNSGTTFLPPIYLLLLWALYRDEDPLTADAVRSTRDEPLDELARRLQGDHPPRRLDALSLFLVIMAATYFFTGWAKVTDAGLAWFRGDHLARIIQYEVQMHMVDTPVLASWLLAHPVVLTLAAIGTVLLELMFLPVVLLRRNATWIMLGILGMHTAIALAKRIFFFDQYILFALFLPWDRMAARLQPRETLTVLYDEDCLFCTRSLLPFRDLDADGRIRFVGPDSRPAGLEDHPLDREMAATDGHVTQGGYHAFRALVRHTGILRPVAWVMSWRFVAHRGERLYAWVARNRHHISTCSVRPMTKA